MELHGAEQIKHMTLGTARAKDEKKQKLKLISNAILFHITDTLSSLLLPSQTTSLGFVSETFDAWVEGIASAVVMAHNRIQPADVFLSEGELRGANINRSPTSYLLNSEAEVCVTKLHLICLLCFNAYFLLQ
jgi:hypothetical protein